MIVIDEALLDQFRGPGRCEFCGALVKRREAAHVLARGMGGGSRLDVRENLVALCGPWDGACHLKSHQGQHPTTQDLLEVVAKREQKTAAEILDYLWKLKRKRP